MGSGCGFLLSIDCFRADVSNGFFGFETEMAGGEDEREAKDSFRRTCVVGGVEDLSDGSESFRLGRATGILDDEGSTSWPSR